MVVFIKGKRIRKQVMLLKADIDRYVSNPDFQRFNFPKGKSFLAYLGKFFILFFREKNHCFRVIFYYRIGPFRRLINWLFPEPFNTTKIWCPDVVGGVFSSLMLGVQS